MAEKWKILPTQDVRYVWLGEGLAPEAPDGFYVVRSGIATAVTDAIAKKIETAIRHYASDYRMMGRMEDGKIHASNVADDLEINILRQVLAALTQAQGGAE